MPDLEAPGRGAPLRCCPGNFEKFVRVPRKTPDLEFTFSGTTG